MKRIIVVLMAVVFCVGLAGTAFAQLRPAGVLVNSIPVVIYNGERFLLLDPWISGGDPKRMFAYKIIRSTGEVVEEKTVYINTFVTVPESYRAELYSGPSNAVGLRIGRLTPGIYTLDWYQPGSTTQRGDQFTYEEHEQQKFKVGIVFEVGGVYIDKQSMKLIIKGENFGDAKGHVRLYHYGGGCGPGPVKHIKWSDTMIEGDVKKTCADVVQVVRKGLSATRYWARHKVDIR